MEIKNGTVTELGLELETGFSTSSEINSMDNQLQFVSSYKWKMGDVNAIYIKKQLLSNQKDENGNRIPYKGNVTEVARKICLAEGMKPEEITDEYLFNRFNNDCDLQVLSEYTRGILTYFNGKKGTKRVLAPSKKDETGKRIITTLDKVASLTNAIHKHLRDAQEEKLKAAGVAQDTIKDTLDKYDQNNKLIKSVKTRVAAEIIVIPVDPVTFVYDANNVNFKGVLYSTNTDNYNLWKSKLKTAQDTHLDYLEIKIVHPHVSKFQTEDLNKMHSGLKTTYEVFDTTVSPALKIPNFDEMYREYCKTSAQTAEDLRAKVMDYRPISDEELLSICKDFVFQNYDVLDEKEKEKYMDIIDRFQTVLTAEEIAKISNIKFSESPNVQKAESMNGVEIVNEQNVQSAQTKTTQNSQAMSVTDFTECIPMDSFEGFNASDLEA